jgi:methyl-accepting chemotaxis protein|tara:strand:+ start:525 stop:1499 length:975 start_codon:yes stop_codon:yes gene_type:complete
MAKNGIPNIKLRRTSAGNLRNFFFLFTIIGIASIFLVRTFTFDSLVFQMTVPGLVIVLYSVLIFQKGKNVLSQDQLGDSVYYLGFILTLWALILALYDLSEDPKAEDIISKFAIALVTTVVGIFVRVFMSQFAPAQEDINEMSEKMLSDTALNLKTQLDVTITTFTGLIDELSRKTSETLEKNSLELSTFLKENSEEFSKASKKIINNLNNASDTLIQKSSSLDKTLEGLNNTTENFNENLNALNSALTQNNPAKEISNLQDVFENMSKSMESYKEIVTTDLKEISSNKKEIFKSLEESREALQKMYNNMSNMSDLIVSKLKRK